jgi:hypothetical protein
LRHLQNIERDAEKAGPAITDARQLPTTEAESRHENRFWKLKDSCVHFWEMMEVAQELSRLALGIFHTLSMLLLPLSRADIYGFSKEFCSL